MFFDEASVKLKQPRNSMMNYCHLIALFRSSITAVLIYINIHTWDVQGFSCCPHKCILPWQTRKGLKGLSTPLCGLKMDETIVHYLHFLVIIYTSMNATISVFLCGQRLTCVSSECGLAGALWWITEPAVKEREWGSLFDWLQHEKSNSKWFPKAVLVYCGIISCKL